MRLIRAACGVLNQTPLDWTGNRDRVLTAIGQARKDGVTLLCLPELCLSGYGCEDAFLSPNTWRMSERMLMEIVPETVGMVVSVGLPRWHQGSVINTACLIADGRIAGFVGKQNLARDGIHYEPRWFRPWPAGLRVETKIQDQDFPLGDLTFQLDDTVLGFEICEDAWVANRPGRSLARRSVDLILNPSASHFAFGKHLVRRRFVLEGARAFSCAYLYANLVGNESGRAIFDGDAMIASCGEMLASGPRFSFHDVHLTQATLDVDAARTERATSQHKPPAYSNDEFCVDVPFEFPTATSQRSSAAAAAWETGDSVKEEEFTRAVSLGLFDYMRKSRSQGFVISLSGGADSSACAVLVAYCLQLAHAELGARGLAEKVAYLGDLANAAESEQIRSLLTCVYQATANSSQTTRDAAEQVAAALEATFHHFDVEPLVQAYRALAEQALRRPLTWEQDDLALQNIQARVRAPSVWLLANVQCGLLLSTSNRSEAAVGYATMDGDTCGGLCPIAGIDKAFLLRWLNWIQQFGPDGLGPVPALRAVTVQSPTAELRPAGSGQTDESDLMPYDVLDAIERAAIRDKKSPVEVYLTIQPEFQSVHSAASLGTWVKRFFRLWSRNQWKRERYAPSFHLDDENLDPKTWCRFPILSGGFEDELRQLDAYLDGEAGV